MNSRELPVPRLRGRRVLHAAIVAAFSLEIAYCAVLVLFVLCPEGEWPLPLGAHARDVPIELVVERRLYAIEGWIAAGALSLYLALTGAAR